METIKLVKLISTFSPHEFKNFGKFIRSSFFNESKKIITYYNFLKSYYPDFKIDNETIQLVYSKIYKNEKFNKKKIRDLSYQLEKLAEDYLGSLMVMQESLDFKRYSLMQISKRKLDLHFESKSREIEKLLNKIKFKDNSYFFKLYLLKRERRFFYETRKPLGKRYEYFKELGEEIEIFILYFIIRVLKYYCVLLRHETEINYKFVTSTIDSVAEYINSKDYNKYPIVIIFYNLLLLLRKLAGDDKYFETKELVLKHSDSLDKSDLILALRELFYYTEEKLAEGMDNFRKENFLLIQEMLKRDAYPEDEKGMSTHVYIKIVKAGIRENKIKWTEMFIKYYKERLTRINKDNAHLYCVSLLLYHRGKLNQSYIIASQINPKDFYFHIFKKIHLIKINFELGKYYEVQSMLKSFKELCKYDIAIPEETKTRCRNFIDIMNKFVNIKLKNEEYRLKQLVSFINGNKMIEEKNWLNSMINKNQ